MENEKDIYDLEVERLQAIPNKLFKDEISEAWRYGSKHSCLFDLIGVDEDSDLPLIDSIGRQSGCLTQIRVGLNKFAFINGVVDEALTQEIRNDKRIPKNYYSITKESLAVFAEKQRKVRLLTK